MTSLGLTPLPTRRTEDELPESAGWADFVPDEVVQELLTLSDLSERDGASEAEVIPGHEFCLSTSDDDFAAVLPRETPIRGMEWRNSPVLRQRAQSESADFRASSPFIRFPAQAEENASQAVAPEILRWESAQPRSKRSPRWWILALFGIVSASVCSLVLFIPPPELKDIDETSNTSVPLLLPEISPLPEPPALDPGSTHFAEAGYALR